MSAADKLRALDEGMTEREWRAGINHWAAPLLSVHVGPLDAPKLVAEMGSLEALAAEANCDGIVALRNVLPALIAVVEAAESYLTITTYDQDPRTWNATVFGACNGLGAALAALDEQLGGGE